MRNEQRTALVSLPVGVPDMKLVLLTFKFVHKQFVTVLAS